MGSCLKIQDFQNKVGYTECEECGKRNAAQAASRSTAERSWRMSKGLEKIRLTSIRS